MNTVTIVTVNYNESAVTIDFLKSISQNIGSHSVKVILVDNGSSQDDEKIFKNVYPELIYIRSEKNLGFAGGNNLGIQYATSDYLLLLNNDTEVTANLINVLVEEMENNDEIGILSPLLLFHENANVIQYAGFSEMNYWTARNKTLGKFDLDTGQYNEASYETGFCHGAAMMCRRKDLEQIGLMEENYFLYYEEMDWCEKFKRAGKKIWFTGKTKVYHKESISVGKASTLKTYFLTRNRILFMRKNTSYFNLLFFGIYFYCLACPVLIIKHHLLGRSDHAKWVWKAMLWNLTQSSNSVFLGFPLTRKS